MTKGTKVKALTFLSSEMSEEYVPKDTRGTILRVENDGDDYPPMLYVLFENGVQFYCIETELVVLD